MAAAEVGLDLSPARRWMAGAMMWLGVSPRIWMMYSPRSVSTTSSAGALQARPSPISSDTIDLPLVTTRAPASRQMPRMMSRGVGAGRAPNARARRRARAFRSNASR